MKQLVVGKQARDMAVDALCEIAEAVGSTLGPAGLPVIFDKPNQMGEMQPTVTKDGVTTISWMQFTDPIKHAVHYFAKQAANHSVLESGDGTSSTVILSSYIAKAIKERDAAAPQAYARQVERHIESCINYIRENAVKDPEAVAMVAKTSANGDMEIVKSVMEALDKTSVHGTILVEKNVAAKERYKVELQDGYNAGRGYNHHPTLAMSCSDKVNENLPFQMEKPYVFLYNGEIHSLEQLNAAVTDLGIKTNNRFTLLVFAYDVAESVCNELIPVNRKYAGKVSIFVSKVRQTAEFNSGMQILMDIAAITNAEIFDGASYSRAKVENLGTCNHAAVHPYKTVLHGRNKNHSIPKRAQQNLNAMEASRSSFDKDVISARNAELTEGLVTIVVGAGHAAAVQERADRVDDAIKAAQAARRGGIVPGCGVMYQQAALACGLPENLVQALSAVTNKVFENLGIEAPPRKENETYAVQEDGSVKVGDYKDLQVCDAAETCTSVLRNACELAIMCSTTACFSLTADLQKMDELRKLKSLISESR
jgi:chaperonin GroEL